MTYDQMALEITQDPAASNWIRNAVNSLSGRDCVDAANDVDTLRVLCELRVDEAFAGMTIGGAE